MVDMGLCEMKYCRACTTMHPFGMHQCWGVPKFDRNVSMRAWIRARSAGLVAGVPVNPPDFDSIDSLPELVTSVRWEMTKPCS